MLAPIVGPAAPTSLTIYYDRTCELCRRCRAWLEIQPTWVPMQFVAADETEARALLPQVPWLGTELVVVGNDGATWVGPAGFLTCLWATKRYRSWSRRLSGPAFAPLAERLFRSVSSNRGRIGAFVSRGDCDDGTCRHHHDPRLGAPPARGDIPW